ncbi:ABC transporter transmembrane domain-containing protein [Sulfitobacter sp. JB4-11]|uniref:ABC transporter transmembrane domain-containing protein n=1 Tax=Sulfitobacter rhodophyticola TaxID=3238304 RepID=UPI003D8161FB
MVLLLVTITLFPLLYLTLELPKRIINDAIGASAPFVNVLGVEMSQIAFLGLLCALFLASVFVHGIMKMRINTMKGVLAERLLRRLRYTLIARILRFPAPYFERTSQGELVSMVTSESEPMGGLMGDALAQPVLQAGQMLTILGFLFIQSITFGLAACALIPLQAWLIPRLQKRINQLNKQRVQQVRALAAEIGEGSVGAATLRTNGGVRYRLAMIADRLGHLYFIRFDIFQKKFFMKFINNFITQLTPFFFYSIGGYLAITGQITVGALVAALAAYKDLSSPWKELLAYYNQTQDMSLRWETIMERFAPKGMVDAALFDGEPEETPRLNGDIELVGVTVRDEDGNAVLEDLNTTLPAGASIGITAPNDEDRRAFAELLIREVIPASGKVMLSGHDLSGLHQSVIAARIGHATSRPVMFMGSFGDNVLMPLKPGPDDTGPDPKTLREAQGSGNSLDPVQANWLDPQRAGLNTAQDLREWWLELVQGMGRGNALFRRGLDQRFDPDAYPDLAAQLVALRPTIAKSIKAAKLTEYVYFFDDDSYNPALPVGDNLMFATPRAPLNIERLAEHRDFMTLLIELHLDEDLLQLAVDMIDLLRQIFGLDGTDHPLFQNLGLDAESYETAVDLVGKRRRDDTLKPAERAHLIAVPFVISAERIGTAFPEDMKTRVLAMRREHAQALQARMDDLFTPLQADQCVPGLTVLENALFGKISETAGAKGDDLRRRIASALMDAGIDRLVPGLIFDMPITLGGSNLPALYAELLAVSRAAIKRPDILILDAVLASYDAGTRQALYEKLRGLLPETTLVYLNPVHEDEDAFDTHFELQQGRIVGDTAESRAGEDSAAAADLARKVAALEQTDLFSGLDRKQLRLLAFGARWYTAKADDYVFHKDDDPTDGAYVLIDGQADLLLPQEESEDTVISTIGPGVLVGELGLIRNVPRALDMKAATDLTCLRIGAEEFLAVVENDAPTAFKLLQVVAGYVSN